MGEAKKIKIAPSILSADFGHLCSQIEEAEGGEADYIHIDVMDGHFVPNITVGPLVVSAIDKCTELPLDVHLMIQNPEFYLEDFILAGADLLSVQLEACTHLHRVIQRIKSFDRVKVGVALNPATALTNLVNILNYIDFALVMSVNPGFGGQDFIPESLEKIALLRRMIDERGYNVEIQVDGGVNSANAGDIIKAGANVLVAGSSIFGQADIARAIKDLRVAASR
ncbi:MAG: ribulose-phosphate 3-epimerase [Candidatus Subteraquimicrobiales bacterium]|nr:ribulose-phosphate 3-epimerase [Candidatus Subteraquimicrobiales bacterium]